MKIWEIIFWACCAGILILAVVFFVKGWREENQE